MAKPLLHPQNILGKSIFAGELLGELEVIDLLVVLQILVNLRSVIETHASPKKSPVILVSLQESMGAHNLLEDFVLGLDQLEAGLLAFLDDLDVWLEGVVQTCHYLIREGPVFKLVHISLQIL